MKLSVAKHRGWVFLVASLAIGCSGNNDYFLDSAIPRVVTPPGQIATVRTRWLNGKLQQTTFLDKQDRVLEDFLFGRTNEKIWNQYAGDKKVFSTRYYHSDSSPLGYINITRHRFEYGPDGYLVRVRVSESTADGSGVEKATGSPGFLYEPVRRDTLISQSCVLEPTYQTNLNCWERNKEGQIVRNLRLYVMKMPQNPRLDTMYYYSHRFAYDSSGRRTIAWYDLMYLGRFYIANGPDTIRYQYDRENRLVREIHRYTTDMRNKREIDTSSLDSFWRRSVRDDRKHFFDKQRTFFNSNRTDTVEYRYEPFEAGKHLPLYVSQDIGY